MGTALAPIASAYLEHRACGPISPKMTMSTVVKMLPMRPEVMSARRIARMALTRVLPSRRVHRSRLPRLLRGRIVWASRTSRGLWLPAITTLRSSSAKLINPRLSPEKRPDRQRSSSTATTFIGDSPPPSSSASFLAAWSQPASCATALGTKAKAKTKASRSAPGTAREGKRNISSGCSIKTEGGPSLREMFWEHSRDSYGPECNY
mmetsp:Transcript_11394/g.26777  ORF Transcript_11394/g.26777 Transcript_11394/m.26777 type:complete len:206 (-) Transcript_11394:39-656(-)